MKKEDYKLYTWYPLTDNEYWVEYGDKEEFPNCQTIICNTKKIIWYPNSIKTYETHDIGWGTMAKQGTWKFMIIQKPEINQEEET